MSALVALAGTMPVAAKASPAPAVDSKASSPVPVTAATPAAAKSLSNAPVTVKASAPVAVAAKAAPLPLTAKAVHKRVTPKTTPVPLVVSGAPSIYLVPVGESRVYRLDRPIKRVSVGDPEVADFIMINSSELYLLGKKQGATNLVVWDQKGNFTSTPLEVSRSTNPLKVLLKVVLPNENDIQIFAWGPAVVLSGSVSDALAAETVYRLVVAYSGGKVSAFTPEATLTEKIGDSTEPASMSGTANSASELAAPASSHGAVTTGNITGVKGAGVVNLLKVRDPQQVRLEVHIAEVSKSLVESLGLAVSQNRGNTQGSLMTGFVSNATLDVLLKPIWDPNIKAYVSKNIKVEAERKNSLIKILAEPTIVTMSGHQGSFLVGGKIYTPSVGSNGSVDYVERTYGVGLRCIPTVLDAGRISLKVTPEVSEPNTEPVTAGTTINLPAFKISYASTTVQMKEGENLVIGGLLRDKLTQNIQRVPLLGDIPLLGTLFRRTEKSSETTELLIFIRPTLVKASATAPELPTDRFVKPTDKELFIDGKLQGSRVK